jgi:hypothetical protein
VAGHPLWHQHLLIAVVTVVSLVPRALALLAFRPAGFTPDSFIYLAQGTNLLPGRVRPSGYPALLRMLAPFHSLPLVTAVQHLLGAATGVLVYLVLRHRRLPAWGAVLAACPTLFDTRQLAVESFILPDALYTFLLTLALALLLTGRGATAGRCAACGLLLAWAAITRANGAPEMLAVLAVLAVQRTGWRSLAAGLAAFMVPLVGYMGLFAGYWGTFSLTQSTGMFLWSRTMTFADCAVIHPPPDLAPLCPRRQHPAAAPPSRSPLAGLLAQPPPASYLWSRGVWWRHGTHPGINAANDGRAMRFALAAIRAQPAGYLRTVANGVLLTFTATDRPLGRHTMHFALTPGVPRLSRQQSLWLRQYAHTTSDTHPVQPYAYLLMLYQEPVYFPGALFALVLLVGLVGAARDRRRRGGAAALPWVVAVIGIVVPVAVHEYHYRYALPVIPAACLAAGLAFTRARAFQPRTFAALPAVPAPAGEPAVPASDLAPP